MTSYRLILASMLLAIVVTGCATTGQGGTSRNTNVIVLEEIERSSAQNVFELVQATRPNWLRTRGTQTFREGNVAVTSGDGPQASVAVIEGTGTIVTYLDNARLGGVNDLRQIPLGNVASVQFLSAPVATNRFGGGHNHGAIVINSRMR